MRTDGLSALSLKHLGALIGVVDAGSVADAAQVLHRTPSTIARSVGLAEKVLGVPLIHRGRGRVRPTDPGRLVLARARGIRRDLQALSERAAPGAHAARLMEIDASRLQAIAAVHDQGSTKRAAAALGVSQPAVSSAIRQAEADLGTVLFERAPGGMVPTSSGRLAAVTAKRVLNELRQLAEEIASTRGRVSGLVRIAGLAYSRSWLLPEAIAQTTLRFPGIVVRTVEGPIDTLVAGVHAGEIDVILCARPDSRRLVGLSVEDLVHDRMELFVNARHPLATERRIAADRILGYPFILPPEGSATREALDRVFEREAGRAPVGTVETSSYAIIKRLLAQSQHVSFRSTKEFREEVAAGEVAALDLGFGIEGRMICILQRAGAIRTPAIAAVLALVRDAARGT